MRERLRLTEWLILIAIVLVAAWLRFYHLGDKGLWGDEIAQAKWSLLPLVKLWARFRDPPDLLLHFLLVQFAEQIGSNAFWIRLPSAFTGLLAVPATFVLTRRVAGMLPALLAMFLMAVAPFQIWYAQDARMYAPLALYATLSFYFFTRLLARPDRCSVAGLTLANGLGMYNHFFGAMPVIVEITAAFGIGIASLIRFGGPRTAQPLRFLPRWGLPFIIALGLTLLLTLPLVPGIVPYLRNPATTSSIEARFDAPPFQVTLEFVFTLLTDFGLGPDGGLRTVVVALLALTGFASLVAARPQSAWLTGLALGLPLILLQISQPERVVAIRYLILLQPVYLLLCAQGLTLLIRAVSRFAGRWVPGTAPSRIHFAATAVVVILAAAAVVAPLEALYARAKLNDWQTLADYLNTHAAPGDILMDEKDYWAIRALAYYLPNLNAFSSPPGTLAELTGAASANRNIWYISFGGVLNPEPEAWVKQRFTPVPTGEWARSDLDYRATGGFSYPQSEQLVTLYHYAGSVPTQISYANELGDRNTATPHLPLTPGEWLIAELERTGVDKSLRFEYTSKSPAEFQVMVNGERLAHVRDPKARVKPEAAVWALPEGRGKIRIEIKNLNQASPLLVKSVGVVSK